MMTAPAFLRWLTPVVIIANVALNGFYEQLFGLPSIGEVSSQYNDLFTPAGYVFSIWGLIYLSFIIYAFIQLSPPPRKRRTYAALSLPLMLANVLAALWIIAFTSGQLVLSLLIILCMLGCAAHMFRTAVTAYFVLKRVPWLPLPFSLFFGWISVATLANLSVLLAAHDLSLPGLAILFIVLATLAAGGITLKYGNYIYPAVIAWAASGIWVARRADYPVVATVALFSILINLVFIIVSFARHHLKKLSMAARR